MPDDRIVLLTHDLGDGRVIDLIVESVPDDQKALKKALKNGDVTIPLGAVIRLSSDG